MADSERKTIMTLFAHPDDELGCIGTLANHAARGDRVILAWTTCGELTTHLQELSPEETKKERIRHGDELVKIIGAEKAIFLDFGDGHVENTRDQRVAVAKMYVEEKPDAVFTWGFHNNHSDHKNTAYLALEAIKFARVNHLVGLEDNHRKNVVLLQYFEKESFQSVRYFDVTDTIEQAKEAVKFYADIYDWKNAEDWVVGRRRSLGMESNCKYAEKFNIRFDFNKPSKYAI